MVSFSTFIAVQAKHLHTFQGYITRMPVTWYSRVRVYRSMSLTWGGAPQGTLPTGKLGTAIGIRHDIMILSRVVSALFILIILTLQGKIILRCLSCYHDVAGTRKSSDLYCESIPKGLIDTYGILATRDYNVDKKQRQDDYHSSRDPFY